MTFSRWVQVLTAKMTPSYISSILQGKADIVGSMEITRTPWFNFFHPAGQLRILLSAFQNTTLQPPQPHPTRRPVSPADIRPNADVSRSKRSAPFFKGPYKKKRRL